MNQHTTIRIRPNPDLLKVLSALGIRWQLLPPRNGEGEWALVEMDPEADERLLDVWERLTDLRLCYLDYRQRSHAIQLALPFAGAQHG